MRYSSLIKTLQASLVARFFGSIMLVVVVWPVCAHAATPPSSATLAATYSGDTGRLTVTQTLNRNPVGRCVARLRGLVSYEDSLTASAVRTLRYPVVINSKTKTFRAYRLPEIRRDGSSNRAILTLQSRVTCQRSGIQVANIVSNADSVYLACGSGARTVSPGLFIRTLTVAIH